MLLRGMDGHTAWANKSLLQRAGITEELVTKLPEGDQAYYGLGAGKEPNGFLVDKGMDRLMAVVPELTKAR